MTRAGPKAVTAILQTELCNTVQPQCSIILTIVQFRRSQCNVSTEICLEQLLNNPEFLQFLPAREYFKKT